jgi:acyl carrier protein
MNKDDLEIEIKQLIIDKLNLEDIKVDDICSDSPLFVEGLGLDSIDALELGMALQKKYHIKLKANDHSIRKYFTSVKTISDYIKTMVQKEGD